MSAPDFYFAVNAIFRHLHDRYGRAALVDYWRSLGREYYAGRSQRWRAGGPEAIAADWRDYFAQEPQAEVEVVVQESTVTLDVRVCPAIKHLRDCGREIVPYYCEHCDHVCGAMAEAAGYVFERQGGMGSCQQQFIASGSEGTTVKGTVPFSSTMASPRCPRKSGQSPQAGEAH
jgi:hypothetical protein